MRKGWQLPNKYVQHVQPGACAEQRKQLRNLEAVKCGDVLQESVFFAFFFAFGLGHCMGLSIAFASHITMSETCMPKGRQARTTKDTYISSSSDFSERKKIIELIHPESRVVGTMSPISYLFVPAKMLNHAVQSVSRAAHSSSMFWEPIPCSNNPSLSWQG